MNQSTEAHYRDLVAADLSIIDKSLTLVGTEHEIRLPDGQVSRIDILAKDKFGCFTVIEIKKSNKTARSTIQQLYKYANFLKKKNRLRADQIRCIALSTNWEELRAPFSEFSHFSEYESISLQLMIDGCDTYSIKEVKCEYEVGGGEVTHNYIFFEFKSEIIRNRTFDIFINSLPKITQSLSSVIIKLNAKTSQKMVNPYGFSWSIFRTGKSILNDELCALKCRPDISSDFFSAQPLMASWSDGSVETELRELILSKMPIVKNGDGEYGCYAIHSLNNDLHRWDEINLLTQGPMFEDGLYSKDEARAFACGFLGEHPYNFVAQVTPKRPSHLVFVREQIQKFLKTNPRWQQSVSYILDELDSNVEADIIIYNPLNFCGWLTDLYRDGTSSRIPNFEITVTGGAVPIRYFGTPIWNGMISKTKLKDALRAAYPSERIAQMRSVNQWVNEYDDRLFRKFGIKHEAFKQTAEGIYWLNTWEVPARWEKSAKDLNSLTRFLQNNDHLVEAAGRYFAAHSLNI